MAEHNVYSSKDTCRFWRRNTRLRHIGIVELIFFSNKIKIFCEVFFAIKIFWKKYTIAKTKEENTKQFWSKFIITKNYNFLAYIIFTPLSVIFCNRALRQLIKRKRLYSMSIKHGIHSLFQIEKNPRADQCYF